MTAAEKKAPLNPFLTLTRAAPARAGISDIDRHAVRRALDETQEALRAGAIAASGRNAAESFESSVAGAPESGGDGAVVARVVAAGSRRDDIPPVPLEGMTVRVRVGEKEVAEKTTDAVGFVSLPLGDISDTRYEVEVLAADCSVLLCQHGRVDTAGLTEPHLLELPRSDALKPQLERAKPLEKAIGDARHRARLAEEVVTKALKAQEKRLREYLAQLEEGGTPARREERPSPDDRREPPPVKSSKAPQKERDKPPRTRASQPRPAKQKKSGRSK